MIKTCLFFLILFKSSLCIAEEFTPLIEAIRQTTSEDAINFLIENGADVNAENMDGKTVLMLAAMYNPNPIIFYDLIKHGARINAKTFDLGQTALFLAAQYNKNPEIIAVLLSSGANKYEKDVLGKTPFDYVLRNKALKESSAKEMLKL